MRLRLMLAIPVAALLLAAVLARPALAGGWATVELSSTPDGVRAGEEWVVDLTILRHGRTPLANVEPAITVSERRVERSKRFVAPPTEQTGVYRARVTFPSAGRWEYRVDDGFSRVQTYPVVSIGEPAPPPVPPTEDVGGASAAGGSRPALLVLAVALGLAAAGLTFAMRRRRDAGRHGSGAPAAPASP